MRSKLFVPGGRPDFFDKALGGDADALSFDLEDAVPQDGKAAARARLAEYLASDAVRMSTKTIIVRVNDPSSTAFDADLAALAAARVDMLNLPKINDADMLRTAAARIARAMGRVPSLLVNIETPNALARAADIGAAHQAVVGLQVGLNDLFATLGITRRVREHVQTALWSIRLAAGEAGCFASDGAWPDIADSEGFIAEAQLARSLGFVGKSCIHPRQVALANAVFGVEAQALERARRLVAAARDAAAAGHGAFAFEGAMVDRPIVAEAEALLARANRGER
ncbi:MAG: CoA ester lyase [Sphingomonas adhaesiva]|uniref:HpcH/HpaI aldolase/citrate lyase family protein n=1 Tax=Sphingomonas adhaesiva TaxID=28212 RepID=UPI002FF5D9F9